MATTAEKGTKDNPYSMDECNSMLDAETWPGGYVRDDAGTVSYVAKSATVMGYSSSGSDTTHHGSDYEFSTGSYEWYEPDMDNMGREGDGEDHSGGGNSGNSGNSSTGTGGNTGGGNTGGTANGNSGSSNTREQIVHAAAKYVGRNERDDIELIKTWLRTAGFSNPTNSTPWCAAFAYNMFQEAGYEGYKSASVSQWKTHYGMFVEDPEVGDVAFFPNMSHIGIVVAVRGSLVTVIHGNWSNMVSKTEHEKNYFDAFKRGR